ncbi:Uma2 family endonuclease [Haliscomenobacter sp.]|uniref:Uma2 family endonuclease n=1 Tax=Haliscomenobacter sp. TaxID=2717303 RepID=UPI003364F7B6
MVLAQDLRSTILERLKAEEVVRIPASEVEYFAVADQLPFKVEYQYSEIITMGLASYFHEIIVANWIFILRSILADEFTVLGSNSGIQIPKFEGGYYLPDVMVVKGEPVFKPNSTAIITNPYLIVDIHSPTTAQFDSDIKLPEYKQQDSLQQIIYVNQDRARVSSYRRTDQPNTWINQEFFSLEEVMQVEGQEVLIKDIYRKIKFE